MDMLTSAPLEEERAFEPKFETLRFGSAADWLDLFGAALCFVDRDLRVIASNTAAHAFIGDHQADGLLRLLRSSTGGHAAARMEQLRDAIAHGVGATQILETDEFGSLVCTIRPTAPGRYGLGMVMLAPLKGGSEIVISTLRRIYSLSKAEAEIAVASAAGMDVIELAQSRQVSVHTLRTQVASLKSKMHMTRMTEVAVTVCRIEAAQTWF